jgi:hypothetical protein
VDMQRTLSIIHWTVALGLYILFGVVGIFGMINGLPFSWIAVALAAVGLSLRGFVVWALRRQGRVRLELRAKEAEPGYVKPTITLEQRARTQRRRRLAYPITVGPIVAVAIAAVIARPFLPEILQSTVLVFAAVMVGMAVLMTVTIWRALKKAQLAEGRRTLL